MPDLRVYLNAEEMAYVKRHPPGFVRKLVKWSLAKEQRTVPERQEVSERFEEAP